MTTPSTESSGPRSRRTLILVGAGSSLALALALLGFLGTKYLTYRAFAMASPMALEASAEDHELERALRKLETERAYIVIDRNNNRLWVRKGDEILLDAVVSAGSGRVLDDEAGGRSWTFDTPKGEHRVRGLLRNPIWRRPDWAFIEEGKPLPKNASERFEDGVLGEYALDLGDGYLIHGTLYERLLGRSVTHGCIRVGRDDLRTLVELTGIGTQVFIF